MQRARDAALRRYLADTRQSVSPPAVSTADAAAQLAALANFLKGKKPAPAFFQVDDAPENPPEYGSAQDLLALPKEPGPALALQLASPNAEARLAELARQRDEFTDMVLPSSGSLQAQTGIAVGPAVAEQAAGCREVAPALRKLAQDVRLLADAERAVYAEPKDFTLRYRGAPEAPPPPLYGRFYLAARALSHSAAVLEKYAKVLDLAAHEIPQAGEREQSLAGWLAQRARSTEVLRSEWRKRASAGLEDALPALQAKLAAGAAGPDALRQRMLDDLRNTAGLLGAAYNQALAELDAAAALIAGQWNSGADARATVAAVSRALEALRKQEEALRLLRVRALEQDLNYLDLDAGDAGKIISAALSKQADEKTTVRGRSAGILRRTATAAKQTADELEARRRQLETDLETAVSGLRRTWREKTSVELRALREEQEARQREIAALRTRAAVAAEAGKLAADAAAKVGVAAWPEIEALSKVTAGLAASKNGIEAAAAVAQARQAVAAGYLYLLQHAAKIMERLAGRPDMLKLRAFTDSRDSIRAWNGVVQSDSLLHAATNDSRLAAQALVTADWPAAGQAMERSRQQISQAQEGLKAALQEDAKRSVGQGLYKCLFDGLYVSLGAAMFSLLAFYIASAAYRAFRIKSAEALLLLLAALLVMLGQIPFGAYLWPRFPQARLWVLQVFSTPAFRAIALGAAVAGLAMAMRMWLSLETSAFYREEEERV